MHYENKEGHKCKLEINTLWVPYMGEWITEAIRTDQSKKSNFFTESLGFGKVQARVIDRYPDIFKAYIGHPTWIERFEKDPDQKMPDRISLLEFFLEDGYPGK